MKSRSVTTLGLILAVTLFLALTPCSCYSQSYNIHVYKRLRSQSSDKDNGVKYFTHRRYSIKRHLSDHNSINTPGKGVHKKRGLFDQIIGGVATPETPGVSAPGVSAPGVSSPGVTKSVSDTTSDAGTGTTTTGQITTDTSTQVTETTTASTTTTIDITTTTTTTTTSTTIPTSETTTLPSSSIVVTTHSTQTSNPVIPTKAPPTPSKGEGSRGTETSTATATSTPGAITGDSSSSSSNKTAITVGAVVGSIVVAGGIGVWIFRKAKLSPSNQFKTKIKNSDITGSDSAGAGSIQDYDNYTDIFRSPNHPNDRPLTANSMSQGVPVSAAVIGGGGGSIGSRRSPTPHHEEYQYQDYDDYQDYSYDNQYPQQQQIHANTGTVPDYGQYRWHGGPSAMASAGNGYESGVHNAVLGPNSSSQGVYGYQDYGSPHHDRFLRELRE